MRGRRHWLGLRANTTSPSYQLEQSAPLDRVLLSQIRAGPEDGSLDSNDHIVALLKEELAEDPTLKWHALGSRTVRIRGKPGWAATPLASALRAVVIILC